MSKQSEVTIDDLAIMVAKGFKEVHEKISETNSEVASLKVQMKKGFEEVHAELKVIKSDIVVIKKDIVEIKKDIVSMKHDIASTKDDVATLVSQLSATDKTVYKDHAPRLRRLEHAVKAA